MEPMVFNVVRVVGVEPGAELDGTVYDQWVQIDHSGSRFSVFDHMLIMPEHSAGELHEVKLSFMATAVTPERVAHSGVAGNVFSGEVVNVLENGDSFNHIIDVNGLKVHLLEDEKHPVGQYLEIRGRLDLDDMHYPSAEAWEPAGFD